MAKKKVAKEDEKLRRMLETNDEKVTLGETFKSEVVRLILVKSDNDDENDFKPSGRAICTLCKSILSANDGGHITRHVNLRCEKRRAISEPPPELSIEKGDVSEEPPAKQRKLTEFSQRKFTKDQTSKITNALAKHALLTGKSFNYITGSAMKTLLIDVANSTGSGWFGNEAMCQIPCRKTVQKVALSMSDRLISRAFEELKPFAGKRVNLIVDHGKIVVNYLSVFASFLDEKFNLKVIPIGFCPCIDSKKGAETAKVITERMTSFGWTEDEVKACTITADGALKTLASHFSSYIRCVSHSIHLLAEKVIDPLETHKKTLDACTLEMLEKASLALQHAQHVSSAIRNNIQMCGELSKLPTLPNDTRWLNGLKCLEDVTELASEIQNSSALLSSKGRKSFYWLSENSKCVNSILHVLKPLLKYSVLFQTQKEVTLHHVLPAYKVLETKWRRYKSHVFTDIEDKDSLDLDLVQSLSVSGLLAINHYSAEFEDYHYGAVLLSPRTKKMTNFSAFERETAIAFVSDALPQDSQISATNSSVLPDFIREMSDQTADSPKHDEFKRYIDEFVDMNSCETIEDYWRRKQLDFPALYQVAAKILSIVPSESVCETTFSTAAYLLDKRRSRLQYATAEKIVVGCQIAAKFPEWVDQTINCSTFEK